MLFSKLDEIIIVLYYYIFIRTRCQSFQRYIFLYYRTHNNLVHLINKSFYINYVLEKISIKFIWTLINSQNQLYNQIVNYSLYNCITIIGENVRYFMNKYDISRDYWNSPINILYNKINILYNKMIMCSHFNKGIV